MRGFTAVFTSSGKLGSWSILSGWARRCPPFLPDPGVNKSGSSQNSTWVETGTPEPHKEPDPGLEETPEGLSA